MQHTFIKGMQRVCVALAVVIGMTTTLVAQQKASLQIPQTMNYQVVIRNADNNVVTNSPVRVRISIIRGVLSPVTVYAELHDGITNANGLLTAEIGKGQVETGVFATIDWAVGPYAIRTEAQIQGDQGYTILSTSPLLAVPYALNAQSAERATIFDYKDLLNKPLNVSSFSNDAGYVTREELGFGKTGESTQAGVSSTSWSTSGNKLTDSDIHKFGTTDYEDVVFVTNDVTRMRLTGAGDAKITNNVTVGKTVEIGTDLTVKKNVYLNTVSGSTTNNGAFTVANSSVTLFSGKLTVDGTSWLNNTLDVDGATTLNNTLDVDGATTLNSTLDVDGGTTLNSTLDVDGATTLNRTLDVDGATTLNKTLDVDGATTLNNALDVDGVTTLNSTLDVDGATTLNKALDVDGATTLNNTLDVDGATTLNSTLDVDGATWLHGSLTLDEPVSMNASLDVGGTATFYSTLDVDGGSTLNNALDVDGATTLNSTLVNKFDQANHVSVIENTNSSDGDGLLIKLGRTHGAWDGSSYVQIANPASIIAGSALTTIKGWLNGTSIAASDLFTIFPGAAIAGAIAQITNTVIDEINDGIGLPLTILPSVQVFPGFSLDLPDIPGLTTPGFCCCDIGFGEVCVPEIEIFPGFSLPDISIPSVTIGPYALPAIPNIPTNGLPTIAVPNFSGTSVTNSLTRENHFVTFQDKDGRQAGAIKAESVSDWRDNTVLDDVYLTNLAASFIGIDLLGAAVNGFANIIELVDSYNKIGVAFESGNGDYAEWLERADPSEYLAAGDIVGVRGGKISKDITGAEQTMVISHKPIVLGNVPSADKRANGNDVAFMGQVPVKIMGPVATGDFIVASGTIKGYGVAISASKMQLEDYTKVVGRSWQNIPTQGPKMVNTVIGVHHDDWVSSVKKIDARQTNFDSRVDALESKLQSILGLQLDNKPQVTP